MKQRDTALPLRAAKWMLATATVLLAALLIVQCAGIYAAGTSAENLTETGVYIRNIYSPEIIAEHFFKITWAAILWLAAFVAVLVFRAVWPEPKSEPPSLLAKNAMKCTPQPDAADKDKTMRIVRIALYAAALALLIAGIANGGMRDVLVKAINICTECIGLG